MANTEGMKMKFTVIKNDDLEGVFESYPEFQEPFEKLCRKVGQFRNICRRTAHPTYLVINTDEPYADQVIDILKANGHWG